MNSGGNCQKVYDFLLSKGKLTTENEDDLYKIITLGSEVKPLLVRETIKEFKKRNVISFRHIVHNARQIFMIYINNPEPAPKEKNGKTIKKPKRKKVPFGEESIIDIGSHYSRIKSSLNKRNIDELVSAAKSEYELDNQGAKRELIAIFDKHKLSFEFWYSIDLFNFDQLPKELLVEFLASVIVMRIPSPPEFSWARYWNGFYHGRHKGGAYPRGLV